MTELAGGHGAQAPPAGRGAAFFDLDKTLMQGSSGFQFARVVRAAGLISRRQLARDAVANLRFRLRGVSDDESHALRIRIASSLAGVRVRDLERLGVHALKRILPRLYPQMLKLAYEHQDAGRPVYIVTAASQDMALVLARVMSFDGALGSTLSEVQDGVFTGRPAGDFLYGAAKAEAITRLALREGLDLEASFAYSDSASDAPMLRAVGHPVAVNPDAELERLAREAGWQIMRLDRLGLKLRLAGALAVAATASATTAAVLGRGGRLQTPTVGGR
ncbi:HAD family phosphatase [Conexibacter sp. S30A1]|uniref:HAD family hydrolase n=1 Tax=Conexibacter sp. S30A1 TaxID=2937800 RepID=UPI00200F8803|nr:HAD-IB family hydrolase [Conexibacter sp. S30A1]